MVHRAPSVPATESSDDVSSESVGGLSAIAVIPPASSLAAMVIAMPVPNQSSDECREILSKGWTAIDPYSWDDGSCPVIPVAVSKANV